jgi:hypothetical protein
MRRVGFISLLVLVTFAAASFAQPPDPAARAQRWKEFSKHNFDKFDFRTKRLTPVLLKDLGAEELGEDSVADDFALLRGVVFGKHGRVFKEQSIQLYLEKQPWYKPNPKFSNSILTKIERDNLDTIRITEAEKHETVEPGDMRIWRAKLIPDEKLRTYSGAEITILAAEVEAIHGKTFSEEWLQDYFNDRYWYKANPAYDPSTLTDVERKNIARLNEEKATQHRTAIEIGEMDHFQHVALTEEKLAGLTLLDLRILREEFYARHGKKFVEPGIADYFNWQDWYKIAKNQAAIKLNPIEQQNVDLLYKAEWKIRESLATTPIGDDTLGDMFAEDLRVLRNEVYARHGRIFKDAKLQKYFESQAWYKANPDFKDDQLNDIEVGNLNKIRAAEESATSKFAAAEG